MKRRNLLKRIGSASVATIALSGTAAAESEPGLDADVKLDVVDIEGPVPLKSVLSDDQIPQLPADINLDHAEISVTEDVDEITLSRCCVRCKSDSCYPGCDCCYWECCEDEC